MTRRAGYLFRLSVDPPAAKEVRLFGLHHWVVENFASLRRHLLDRSWEARRFGLRDSALCMVIVVAANGLMRGAGVSARSAWSSPEFGVSGTVSPHTVASERASSVALWKRDSGSRPSARTSQASNPGGKSGAISDGTGSGAVQSFTSTSPTASPSKGSRPVMQRKAMTPTDHKSDR